MGSVKAPWWFAKWPSSRLVPLTSFKVFKASLMGEVLFVLWQEQLMLEQEEASSSVHLHLVLARPSIK